MMTGMTAIAAIAMYGMTGYRRGFYYDNTILLLLAGSLICILASASLKSTVSKYNRVRSRSGLTGAEAARRILMAAGVTGVVIRPVSGSLTDHYDPASKTVNLSTDSFDRTTLTAVGVAAHECGHAIQHAQGYAPLKMRTAIVPAANLGSQLSWPIFVAGLIFSIPALYTIGIAMFSLAVLFQLVTLPVELNASRRALKLLESTGILAPDENKGARKVLTAAAMTYVAALASSILQMVRLILLARGRRRDD